MTTSKDTGKPGLRVQDLSQPDLSKISRDLVSAFSTFAADFREVQRKRAEALEVAALFELYRQFGKARGKEAAEVRVRLTAALEGYDTAHLADLITFGQYLSTEAQPIWSSRDR